MSMEPIQNPLFDDPLGITLKHARQRKELTVEAVARQLRLPSAVIEAMEREAWQTLGAPIYVKSYLGSYLKLLGLPETLAANVRSPRVEASLVTMAPTGNIQRTLDRSWRRIIYMVMTGVLVGSVAMLAIHLQSRAGPVESISLGAPLDADTLPEMDTTQSAPLPVPAATEIAPTGANGVTDPTPAESTNAGPTDANAAPATPVAASLAPLPVASDKVGLVLRFHGESWVDIVDAKGQRLERGMVEIGAERRYAPGAVSRITLGNASMIEVLMQGQAVDLRPYSTENVARFGVSSEGRISAPGG